MERNEIKTGLKRRYLYLYPNSSRQAFGRCVRILRPYAYSALACAFHFLTRFCHVLRSTILKPHVLTKTSDFRAELIENPPLQVDLRRRLRHDGGTWIKKPGMTGINRIRECICSRKKRITGYGFEEAVLQGNKLFQHLAVRYDML